MLPKCAVPSCEADAAYEVILYDFYPGLGARALFWEQDSTCPYICWTHAEQNEAQAKGAREPRGLVHYPYTNRNGARGFSIYAAIPGVLGDIRESRVVTDIIGALLGVHAASPFEVGWQRVRRAAGHHVAFGEAWSRFLASDPYETRVSVSPDGTGSIWIDRQYPCMPPVLALELGEMLYQLRSALDACIYQAAIMDSGLNPPPNERNLEFPIRNSEADFLRDAPRMIGTVANQRQAIVESMQPYNQTKAPPDERFINESLEMLSSWAKKDRHRALHVVGSWSSNAQPKLRTPPGTGVTRLVTAGNTFLEEDSEIAEFFIEGWTPGMHLQANPDVWIDAAVKDLPPRDDSDLLGHRCSRMIRSVATIIRKFEQSL